jgi:hypothetical protein
MPEGYAHPSYAAAFCEFGTPRFLSECRGWILERTVGEGPQRDAMGGYPLFTCDDWSRLPRDLAEIDDLVSLSLVTDPFAQYDSQSLAACFPDLAVPFKSHFVTDLSVPFDAATDAHHRRNVRKALKRVTVDLVLDPTSILDEWLALYAVLVDRHAIHDMRAFSRSSFAAQFSVPGLVAFRAKIGDQTVGMVLWYEIGDVAYYHLGAYTEVGYQVQASFGLFATAIDYFRGRRAWLGLGAGAGLSDAGTDGLSRFKRGWATGTRVAYLCGRIFDLGAYRRLSTACESEAAGYFPAYRHREFAA